MINNYDRDYCKELLLNSGGSVTKTIHGIDVDVTPEQIKNIVLHNHSNLKTPSQRLHAHNSIQQKPDEALQTYNSRYESHFHLAYPDSTIDDAGSRTQCIHYASLLHGKLGDEMEGRFNQELPESLHAAFKKAINFEPCILTKQTIYVRMNEVNQIDVSLCDDEFQVKKAHIRNPNYKGKKYDLNYQNRNKNNNNNNSSNSPSNTGTGYSKHYNNNGGNSNNTKSNFQDKPTNVHVTLTGPVNRDQLFRIQEVLRHPSQY